MRRFLKKLALFLALGFSGYALLLGGVAALSVRATQSCRLAADVDSVMIGDSHPMWSIDDSNIPGLRNVSLNAEGFKYTYEKLDRILKQDPKVKHVYLGADVHNFAAYYDEYIFGESFKFFAYRYLGVLDPSDYLELARHSPGEIPSLSRMLITEGFFPGLRKECALYGSFPDKKMTQVYDEASMQKRISAQYFDGGNLRGLSESNLENFRRIVELCRERGVKLTIVSTPVHPEYRSRVPQRFVNEFEKILRTENLDHYAFDDLKLPDSAFLPDGDHVNFTGAQLTTEKFRAHHGTR